MADKSDTKLHMKCSTIDDLAALTHAVRNTDVYLLYIITTGLISLVI